MEKKIAIELIKLELLNSNNKQDEEALTYLKKNSDEFPWNDYGDYQNLIAVLAVSEKLKTPPTEIKEKLFIKAQQIKKAVTLPENLLNEHPKVEQKLNIYKNSAEVTKSEAENNTSENIKKYKPVFNESGIKENKSVLNEADGILKTKDQLKKAVNEQKEKIEPSNGKSVHTDIKKEVIVDKPKNLVEDRPVTNASKEELNKSELPKKDVSKSVNEQKIKTLNAKAEPIKNENKSISEKKVETNPENQPTKQPLQSSQLNGEKAVNKTEIKPEIENELNTKISRTDSKLKENKPDSEISKSERISKIITPQLKNSSEKIDEQLEMSRKSIEVNIEEELSKIENEVLKDIENMKKQLTEDVKDTEKIHISDKKEPITFKDPDLFNVRTILKEASRTTVRDRKKSSEPVSSIQKHFKTADWEESVLIEEKDVPSTVPPLKLESKAHDDEKIVVVENNSEGTETISETFHTEKEYPRRKDNRAAILTIGISIIVIPLLLYFIFFNNQQDNSSQDQNVNQSAVMTTNSVTPVELQTVPKQEEVDVPQSTEQKNIVSNEPVITPKQTLPPPPESPKIIETPISDKSEEVTGTKLNTESKLTDKDISVAPMGQMKKVEEEKSYFVAVEEMPEPIGGLVEIQRKVIYPTIASAAGIEGKVIVNAYVNEYGNVTRTEVVKGIGYGCDEAAVDAIRSTGFKPGMQRGKPVNVRITIPIVFKRL